MLNSPSLAQLTLNCSSTDLYQFNGILEKWRILMKDLKTWDDNYSLTSCDESAKWSSGAHKIIFNHPILEKVVIITNFGQDNWNEEEVCFAGLALAKLFFFFFFLLLLNTKLNTIISFTYRVLSYPLIPTTRAKQDWVRFEKSISGPKWNTSYEQLTPQPLKKIKNIRRSCSCCCRVWGN